MIIGKPEEAKYGFTEPQLFEGYQMLKAAGVKRFGLHTMVASNELNGDFFVENRSHGVRSRRQDLKTDWNSN